MKLSIFKKKGITNASDFFNGVRPSSLGKFVKICQIMDVEVVLVYEKDPSIMDDVLQNTKVYAASSERTQEWAIPVLVCKFVAEKLGIHQGKVGELSGIPRQQINSYFNLTQEPSLQTFIKIIRGLGIKPYLSYDSDDKALPPPQLAELQLQQKLGLWN